MTATNGVQFKKKIFQVSSPLKFSLRALCTWPHSVWDMLSCGILVLPYGSRYTARSVLACQKVLVISLEGAEHHRELAVIGIEGVFRVLLQFSTSKVNGN